MIVFEDELRKAMARRQPPAGFTAQVLAKTEGRNRKSQGWLNRIFAWRVAPVFALALLLSAGITYQRHEHQARGEKAKENCWWHYESQDRNCTTCGHIYKRWSNETARIVRFDSNYADRAGVEPGNQDAGQPGSFGENREGNSECEPGFLDASARKRISLKSDPDQAKVKDLVSKLRGVYVRSFEFEKKGSTRKATWRWSAPSSRTGRAL